MNINEIWDGLTSIYNQVTPAVMLIFAALLTIWYTSPNLSFPENINVSLEKILKSKTINNTIKVFNLFKLSSLIPLITVALVLVSLITIGDIAQWICDAAPNPLRCAIPNTDLFAELENTQEKAILVSHYFQTNNMTFESKSPNLVPEISEIERYMAGEMAKLKTKYPDRYEQATAEIIEKRQREKTYYGGYLGLTFLILFQLIFRNSHSKWLWFKYTSLTRTLLVFLILCTITIHYRLEWEWKIERQFRAETRVTVDLLLEENPNLQVSTELIEIIKEKEKEFTPYDFWFARAYDYITVNYWSTTHRQLQ
jgi:hypothetical protein